MPKNPLNYRELEPVDDSRPLLALDDRECARLAAEGHEQAMSEMRHRKRFEAAWSGDWSAGIPAKAPQRTGKNFSMTREEQRRAEFRKLIVQSKTGPKTQRAAAKYLLKTCFNKSVP